MTQHRWAWAEIDLTAVGRNVANLKALTRPGTLFMAVVKADGYGHGAVQVARAALAAGADRLGVATVDEALVLREAGITAPLQILSEPPATAIRELLEADIVPTVTTRGFVTALGEHARAGGTKARYHLKIDSGMNRIGVRAEEVAEFVRSVADSPGLTMEGAFTHFATADVVGDWDVERQLRRFLDAVEAIRGEGIDPGVVHAANSPATILYPSTHLDMVRCGIAMYGLHPAASTHGRVAIEPTMAVKARVLRVARIGTGEGVSYGLTWHAAGPTTIATLPIGYADGVRRALSNEMSVLVGGVECRQVGRVCMDQLMVEIPRGLEVAVGDEAVLVGRQARGTLTIEEQAEAAGTIDYEIAVGYGARLERLFLTP